MTGSAPGASRIASGRPKPVDDIYVIPMLGQDELDVLDLIEEEWEECYDAEIASPFWLRARKRSDAARAKFLAGLDGV